MSQREREKHTPRERERNTHGEREKHTRRQSFRKTYTEMQGEPARVDTKIDGWQRKKKQVATERNREKQKLGDRKRDRDVAIQKEGARNM